MKKVFHKTHCDKFKRTSNGSIIFNEYKPLSRGKIFFIGNRRWRRTKWKSQVN